MRRSHLITVIFIGLLGLWLLWRQFVQRQRATHQHSPAPGSSLPVWIPAPPGDSAVKGLASTAERTHNQSDALTQPQQPAPAPLPHANGAAPATPLASEAPKEPDTESETEANLLDDLICIEGIGPKISTIVVAAGITSFSELADTGVGQLKAILEEAGIHTANPSTWPEQAHLAAQGKWDELKELQDRIKNGRLEA